MWIINFFCGGIILMAGFIYRTYRAYESFRELGSGIDLRDMIKTGRRFAVVMIISGLILIGGGVLHLINIYPIGYEKNLV